MRVFSRQLRDGYRRSLQRIKLRRSLAILDRTLRLGRQPSQRLIEQLVQGWANESWSADVRLLMAMLEWLPRTTGSIAECGSGISTLVLASAASVTGRQVHAFEHSGEWAARMLRELPQRLRPSLELHVTPIRSYGEFDWYSLDHITAPSNIGFVVCDGPPGGTRGGRYGLVPILRSRMAPGCVILIDDTQRPNEHAIVRRWCNELDAAVVQEGSTYNVLAVARSPRIELAS
jgi:hypothetical protein